MANNKRYYWFKLKQGFFDSLIQKRVRRHERGYEFQIIYLEIMLISLDKDGEIIYQNLFDTLVDEISERIGEPSDRVEAALSYLSEIGLIELTEESCFIPEVLACTGSETASAERTRRYRAGQASQCDGDASKSDREKEKEREREKEREPKRRKSTFYNFSERDYGNDILELQAALIRKSIESSKKAEEDERKSTTQR